MPTYHGITFDTVLHAVNDLGGSSGGGGGTSPGTGTDVLLGDITTSASDPFGGQVVDVRVYNRRLESEEIEAMFTRPDSPVGWWQLNEGRGGLVVDSSSVGNHGSVQGGTQGVVTSRGPVFSLDGSGYIDIGDESFQSSDFTIAGWWKAPEEFSAGECRLIGTSSTSGTDDEHRFSVSESTVAFDAGLGADGTMTASAGSLNLGEWNFLAVSVNYNSSSNETTTTVYVNGTSNTGSATATGQPSNPDNGAWIGRWRSSRGVGEYSDVRVYDRVLTDNEILGLYHGSPEPQDMASQVVDGGLIGHWPLDDHILDEALDHSGLGRHGNVQGASPVRDGPMKTTSYEFDGVNDGINIGNNVLQESSFTISGWWKPPASGSGFDFRMVSTQDSGGGDYEHRTYYPGSSHVALIVGLGADGTVSGTTGKDAVYGEWNFLTFTVDYDSGANSTTVTGYLDGVVGTSSTATGETNHPDGETWVGRWGSSYTDGRLSDIRIYDRVLTSAEIRALYQGSLVATATGDVR